MGCIDKYVGFIQCENDYNSVDLPIGDHDICNGKDFGETGDTGKKSFAGNLSNFGLK